MKYALATFLLLLATWLVLSGHTEPLLLTFGVLSCLGVTALAWRMGVLDEEAHPFHLAWRPLIYAPWLLWQIVKSNFAVAWIILHPKLPVSPRLLRLRSRAKTTVGQVGFANSITLTPGTITLDVRDRQLLVHALTTESARELAGGEMNRRAAWLEGEG